MVGEIRSPVRPLGTDNVALAFPGELLINPSTGNFIYITDSLGQIEHKKPGTLTVKQGENTLLNAGDLSTALSLNIPLPTWDTIAPDSIAASLISGLTASRALVSSASGGLAVSAVTATELGYLDGVTSSIQTQLNSKLATAGGTISGAITPSTNSTINLGSSAARFRNIYATTFTGALSGNASTASALATARGITIGESTKNFDGSAAISFTLTEIGAAATNHTHSYLPLSGGTLTGNLLASDDTVNIGSASVPFNNVYANTFTGNLSGNATSATTATSATSATTAARLATSRNITIGSSTKGFNGSANISFSLTEIGAAAANHTHSGYLSTSGGTISGTLNVTTLAVTSNATGIQKTYSGTLSTSWSGSAAPYTQAVTVSGILSTDRPIVDFTCSGTYATDQSREEGWLNIYRAVTAANKITFYAHEKPTVSIPFTALVTR